MRRERSRHGGGGRDRALSRGLVRCVLEAVAEDLHKQLSATSVGSPSASSLLGSPNCVAAPGENPSVCVGFPVPRPVTCRESPARPARLERCRLRRHLPDEQGRAAVELLRRARYPPVPGVAGVAIAERTPPVIESTIVVERIARRVATLSGSPRTRSTPNS